MSKILRIENEDVIVKNGEDILKYSIKNLNFTPLVGDDVEILNSDKLKLNYRDPSKLADILNTKSKKNYNLNIRNNDNRIDEVNYNNIELNKKNYIRVKTNNNRVNKVVYVLFAFFGGTFGLHKFYANNNSSGFCYLLFFWTGIPTILGIIDSIIGLTKSVDEYGNIIL